MDLESPDSRISSVRISNFRCYSSSIDVGPFGQITGLIGPNGSGKSSVLEALNFVFCRDETLGQHRYVYGDLVSPGKKGEPVTVELRLGGGDSAARLLDKNGNFSYRLNNQPVDKQAYLGFLRQRRVAGLPVLSQDELGFFTEKSAKNLMQTFENLCGSAEFQSEYASLETQLEATNTEVLELSERIRQLKKEKKATQSLLEGGDKAKQLSAQLGEIEAQLVERNLACFEAKLAVLGAEAVEVQAEVENTLARLDEATSSVAPTQPKVDAAGAAVEAGRKLAAAEEKEKRAKARAEAAAGDVASAATKLAQNQETLSRRLEEAEAVKAERKRLADAADLGKDEQRKLARKAGFEDFAKGFREAAAEAAAAGVARARAGEQKDFFEGRAKACEAELSELRAEERKLVEAVASAEEAETLRILAVEEGEAAYKMMQGSSREEIEAAAREVAAAEALEAAAKAAEAARREESTRQGRDAELKNHLLRVVPGFFGELGELISVSDSRYALAAGVALERLLDHWVVDTPATAQRVSTALRDGGGWRPLLVLSAAPRGEESALAALRAELGAAGSPLFDAVTGKGAPPALMAFLRHRLKGAAVCDAPGRAAALVRRSGRVSVAFSLEGDAFRRDVVESVGARSAMSARLRRWVAAGEAPPNHTDSSGKNLAKARAALAQATASDRRASETMSKLAELREASASAAAQREAAVRRLDDIRRRLVAAKDAAVSASAEARAAAQRWAEADKAVKAAEESKSRRSAAAATKFGADQRRIEAAALASSTSGGQSSLDAALAALDARLSALEVDKLEIAVKLGAESLESLRARHLTAANDLAAAEAAVKAAEAEAAALRAAADSVDPSSETREAETREAVVRTLEERLRDLRVRSRAVAARREKLAMAKVEFVAEVQMQGVAVDPSVQADAEALEALVKDSHFRKPPRPEEVQAAMASRNPLRRSRGEHDDQTNVEQLESEVRRLEAARADARARLASTATSLRDETLIDFERHKVETLSDQLRSLQDSLRETSSRESVLAQRLSEVSAARKSRLSGFLSPLCGCLADSFRFLCGDGRAFAGLTIENPLRPFLGGAVFSATPPSKKFSVGSEGLSAGESSLANLAMFMAINEVLGSPSMFFDEVDAHLDAENLGKFVSAIGKVSRVRQVAFVTHKSYVYRHAKILIGITKHHSLNSPVCFSLSLMTDQPEREEPQELQNGQDE